MAQKKTKNSFLVLTTSFVGGLAAGLLLAPKNGARNRAWLAERIGELSNWVDDQRKSVQHLGKQEVHKFHQHIQQGIHQNVPDLYHATAKIDLSDQKLNGE
ncbi:YtxH domain-containing protein [Fodinibius saliphilus]|uniref:YtxH domain-containing protein n=1 Tax=Fodinibius saliphilus TaxID=1920650 RepID=UPI001108F26D|nr:YtxH domain-containing protein [Fodinibius saliphilus]